MMNLDCPNCRPDSPCNRHIGRNAREINNWLDELFDSVFQKPREPKAQKNEYFSRDDWERVVSIPGKVSEN